jgi:hypothetical protein
MVGSVHDGFAAAPAWQRIALVVILGGAGVSGVLPVASSVAGRALVPVVVARVAGAVS